MSPWRRPAATVDLWQMTMENSPVGMLIVSPAGEILQVNPALCRMLGYEAGALQGLAVQAITHPDDRDTNARLAQETLAGTSDSFRVTKRYLRADGSVMSAELTLVVIRDELGDPLYFVSQILDLSERQVFSDRLEAVEAELDSGQRMEQAIFETVGVGLLLVDADGHYSAYNRRQQTILDIAFPTGHLGHSAQEGFVYDADQVRVLPPEEYPCALAAAGKEFDEQLIWVGEEPSSRRALAVSARAVRDDAGTVTGAALAYLDVTDTMRALKAKDDFVLTVSHELRTPLTSALAYLELLDEIVAPGTDVHHHVAAARRNTVRLSHLVADLLFSTRAMSGSPVIDPYRVDIATVVCEAVEAAAGDLEDLGVQLRCQAPPSLMTVGDGLRLRQVVDNLIDNAVAFSESGTLITVTLSETAGEIVLTVVDQGEGIDETEIDRVFERFFRGANARRRQVPGAGLGLSIVHTIVDAHGGTVSVESTAGDGTTVRVALPG